MRSRVRDGSVPSSRGNLIVSISLSPANGVRLLKGLFPYTMRFPSDDAALSKRPLSPAPRPASWWGNLAMAGLPVLACFLGGATEKWSEGIVIALLGLFLLAAPPRFSLGRWGNGILLALTLCVAVAFLPARWFFEPAWRTALVNDFRIQLPSTLSPQPWLTLGCLISFLAGLSWLYCVTAEDLELRAVRLQLRLFAGGIVFLGVLCLTLYYTKTALPFWHNQRGFGPFPNRNQTGDLLGLTAIIIVACGQDDIRQGKTRWIAWLLGLGVMIAAVIVNFSRAGLAILVVGSGLWIGWYLLRKALGRADRAWCLYFARAVYDSPSLRRANFRTVSSAWRGNERHFERFSLAHFSGGLSADSSISLVRNWARKF